MTKLKTLLLIRNGDGGTLTVRLIEVRSQSDRTWRFRAAGLYNSKYWVDFVIYRTRNPDRPWVKR